MRHRSSRFICSLIGLFAVTSLSLTVRAQPQQPSGSERSDEDFEAEPLEDFDPPPIKKRPSTAHRPKLNQQRVDSSESSKGSLQIFSQAAKQDLTFHEVIHPALRWTTEGGWQPPRGEVYLGSTELYWAIAKRVSLHTWSPPWLIRGVNLGARAALWSGERWTFSASTHLLRINLSQVLEEREIPKTPLMVNPISLTASWALGHRWVVGIGVQHTVISGSVTFGEEEEVKGSILTANTHARAHLGFALSKSWSLWFNSSQLLRQSLEGEVFSEVTLKNGGELEVFGAISSDSLDFAGSRAQHLKLAYRGEVFTTSLGASFGAPPLYYLGAVSGRRIRWLPYFELGWRL